MAIAPSIQRRIVRVPYSLNNFGGLNDDSNNAALDDRDLRISKNMMFYRERLIGGRFGYIKDPFSTVLNSGAAMTGTRSGMRIHVRSSSQGIRSMRTWMALLRT